MAYSGCLVILLIGRMILYSSPLSLAVLLPVSHSPQMISASSPVRFTIAASSPQAESFEQSWPPIFLQQQLGTILFCASLLQTVTQCAEDTSTVLLGGIDSKVTPQ